MGLIRSITGKFVKRPIKLAAKLLLAFHLTAFGIAFARNNLYTYEQKTAVLASDAGKGGSCRHYLQSIGIAFGLYPYVTRYENAGGSRTVWFLHATKSDLEQIADNESYQSIITAGHGGECVWYASDQPVWSYEISRTATHLKPGHWFQLSCGDLRGRPFGRGIVQEHNIEVYDGLVQNPLAIGIDAVRGFPLLRDKESPDSLFQYVLLGRFIPDEYLRMLQTL